MTTYFEVFKDKEDIEKEYDCKLPEDAEILIAWYSYADYEGNSFVLYRQNGKLYEVNGGHCSCNGLEGQWEPEETSIAALKTRKRIYGASKEADEGLTKILKELEDAGDNTN